MSAWKSFFCLPGNHFACPVLSPPLPCPSSACLAPRLAGSVPGREGTESPVFAHEEQPLCPPTQPMGSRKRPASMPTIPVNSAMPSVPQGRPVSTRLGLFKGVSHAFKGGCYSHCKDPQATGSLPSGQTKQREACTRGLTLPAHLLCTAQHHQDPLSTAAGHVLPILQMRTMGSSACLGPSRRKERD